MWSILTLAAFSYFASLAYAAGTANFITNGRKAKPHSAPYIVTIHIVDPGYEPVLICGGSILNENWVLTAGHCVVTRTQDYQRLKVFAGRHNLRLTEKEENGQIRSLKKIIVHENYTHVDILPCDIALIKVAEPFKFNKNVTAIRLSPAHETQEGESTLFGWGSISTSFLLIMPSKLQTANLTLLSYDACKRILTFYGWSLHPAFICTDGYQNVGICDGDSGSPLVQYKKDGEPDLIGISSWLAVVRCGTNNAPSMYTNVSYFIDWINEHMHENL